LGIDHDRRPALLGAPCLTCPTRQSPAAILRLSTKDAALRTTVALGSGAQTVRPASDNAQQP
jgi:hypothetical protein